jgi:hypothetical protein
MSAVSESGAAIGAVLSAMRSQFEFVDHFLTVLSSELAGLDVKFLPE